MDEINIHILNKIKSGELGLFTDIVEKYKDKAFSLVMKILKNREDSEDAVQESFLKLYKVILSGEYESKAKFSTYFYTIVYNTAIDFYRRNKRKNFNISSIEINESGYKDGDELTRNYEYKIDKTILESDGLSTENKFNDFEIKSIIRNYINTIPEQYSVILNLFFINEFSHEEISQLIKIPIGTVKNRIFRAKEKLKTILYREFKEEELREYIKV